MSLPAVTVLLDLRAEVVWPALPADAAMQCTEIIRTTIARVGLHGAFEVSLVITGDAQMRRINRRFRGIDTTTDVLSFPQSAAPLLALPPQERWVTRPFGDDAHDQPFADDALPVAAAAPESPAHAAPAGSEPYHVGDIIIAAPTVERQAAEAGHGAWWECCFLVAHGTLHLLGYDDYYAPGYHAMVAHQGAVLAALGMRR